MVKQTKLFLKKETRLLPVKLSAAEIREAGNYLAQRETRTDTGEIIVNRDATAEEIQLKMRPQADTEE